MLKKKADKFQAKGKESKITLSSNAVNVDSPLTSTSQTLLAWCSQRTNKIRVFDLETKRTHTSFNGAKVHNTCKPSINKLFLICL